MSRKLLFILLIAGVAVAGQGNIFDYNSISAALPCYGGTFAANDFFFYYQSSMNEFTVWVIMQGAESRINARIYEGDANGPITFIDDDLGDVDLTYTGWDYNGYMVWECEVDLDHGLPYQAYTHQWVTFSAVDADTHYYWLCSDWDDTWWSEAYLSQDGGLNWDSTSSLYGTAYEGFGDYDIPISIEEATWGQIKGGYGHSGFREDR